MPHDVLSWDSAFFGFRTARLRDVVPKTIAAEWAAARADGVSLAYFDAPIAASALIEAAVATGGYEADRRRVYTWCAKGRMVDSGAPLDLADASRTAEAEAVIALSIESGKLSRFSRDPRMAPGAGDRLFRIWGENSLSGAAADAILVRRDWRDQVAAICTVKAVEGIGSIGLVAVDASMRGQGLGRAVVDDAIRWFQRAGCHAAQVVTQDANLAAQRTYEAAGFKLTDNSVTFHFWAEPS
jgi:dTDP-4-amino-4,6-dideoxy-D-galactose acyltransferase